MLTFTCDRVFPLIVYNLVLSCMVNLDWILSCIVKLDWKLDWILSSNLRSY